MGKLFLDSANLSVIQRMMGLDCIAGVTTNPSLMAKEEKGNYLDRLREIADLVSSSGTRSPRHLSVEVITLDPSEMLVQADQIRNVLMPFEKHLDLYIKIPVTLDNLEVISKLNNYGINVNATACITWSQAKLAADAGAKIVSFFYNRALDGGGIPLEEMYHFQGTMDHQPVIEGVIVQSGTAIICGSIRKPIDVLLCWEAGAQFVTASEKVIQEMSEHPQTDLAIKQFQGDIDKWLK